MEPTQPVSTSPAPGGWENGAFVGRYVLLSPIAQGGMAEIWLARQSGMKGFEKVVVVKRMINALEADPEHVEMFLTEARLAAQLNHPNVVQIYELGEFQNSYFIAMEYLDGENLSTIRRAARELQTPMPDAVAARLVAWAAEGLHYAHTKVGLDGRPLHIVHRDVSPQNLIVTYDGGLKVVDFGIAKAATHATMSGKLKGKLAYMSPEQARAQALDARSDVFALGIVLFELLSGTRLLRKMTDLEILHFIAGSEPFPRVSERRPDVPVELENIVARAMARDPADRYQSARDLQIALEEWLRMGSHGASSAQVADYMRLLFADRIKERRALIEAAMTAELDANTRSNIARLAEKMEPGSASSRGSSASMTMPGAKKKGPPVVPVAIAGGVALAAFLGWSAWKPPAAAPPSAPVVATTEPAEPKRAPPILAVATDPAGAAVSVDGVARGVAPIVIDTLSFGDHLVEATLSGRQPAKRTVTLEHAGEKTQVILTLAAAGGPAAPPAGAETPASAHSAPAAAPGKLTLKTEPWTTVYLGKKKLGDTPLIGVSVPSGRQVLRLENSEANISSSIEVDIKPNETTVKKMRL